MNVPTNTWGPIPPHNPIQQANPSSSPARGRITSAPSTLRNWDTSRPILRFDFPNIRAQEAFHHAFLQVRSEKDKAAFMMRFFDNYDAQVSIPRRVVMDTSRDEQVAREVQQSLGVVMDTERDAEVARRLQQQMGGNDIGGNGVDAQVYDEEMASLVQRRRDFERRRQGYGGSGGVDHNGRVNQMTDRFGGMSIYERGGYLGYTPQQRRRRATYYDDGNDEPYPPASNRDNGGYGNGYDSRHGNRGQRYGGY